jgi:hypothetical protein
MRIIAFVHRGGFFSAPTQPPRLAPARGPPDREGDFDTCERDTLARSAPLPEYEFDQPVSGWAALPLPTFLAIKAP